MRYLSVTCILLILVILPGPGVVLSQAGNFCPPGQQPHFSYGFAFLKSILGEVMGEPLECEHYDAAGNAFQRTTTGQAFYQKETNTPLFSSGNRRWAWTPAGLKEEVAGPENLAATAISPGNASPRPPPNAPPTSGPVLVRVMSYNILYGAGADPAWERAAAHLSPWPYPGNRLAEILAVVKAADPDILGIQEAAAWDKGTPSLVQQVAGELGMNYFLAQAGNGLHIVLLTKFEIVAAENLSPLVGNVGALRAELALPNGQPLQVFVVHLDPFSAATRRRELTILTQKMAPYFESPTILMGDMNYYCLDRPEQCPEYRALSQAGWRLALTGPYKIDQIWTSPSLALSIATIAFPGANFDLSDHLPVGAVIEVAPTTP